MNDYCVHCFPGFSLPQNPLQWSFFTNITWLRDVRVSCRPPPVLAGSLVTPSSYQRRTSATLGFNFSLQWTFGALDDYVNAQPPSTTPYSVSRCLLIRGVGGELISCLPPSSQKSPWRHFPYRCSQLLCFFFPSQNSFYFLVKKFFPVVFLICSYVLCLLFLLL